MANITKSERRKRETEKSILKVLEENKRDTKPNLHLVEQYMKLYSDLELINQKLTEKFSVALSQERRQILKAMMSVLDHLGLGSKKEVAAEKENEIPEL